MRKLAICTAIALLLFILDARSKSIDIVEWSEEVKLSDGTLITVWRKARAYSGGFPNSSRGRNIDFDFRYPALGLQWTAALSETFDRDPISFDIIDGVPYLTLFVGDREGCRGRLGSDYTAQFMRWANGRWTEVPQGLFPIDRALINLSGDYWGRTASADFKGLVRWDTKRLRGGVSNKSPETVRSYFDRGQRTCENRVKS
jgi:hypothetical protein